MDRKFLFVLPLLLLCLCDGYAQKYDRLIDKTVAIVGNSMITLSQVETEAQMMQFSGGYAPDRNLRCVVLENMMASKLFYTQAILDSLAVNTDMVEAMLDDRVNNIMGQLGGEAETEKYFGKPLYKLRQEWREMLTEQSLVQDMQRKVASSASEVTPREVESLYRKTPKDSLPIIPEQYQISQIALYPDRERANLEVRERLLEFRERILAGEKFSVLATIYSEDPGSAMRGGELGMMPRSSFWPAFSDAAMQLKDGQVSPVVETPDGFHLIQMIRRDRDMFNVRHILLKPRYTSDDRDSAFIRLDSIRNAVLADSISFYDAAIRYSQDVITRTNGGLVANPYTGASLFEKDQLKPVDYNVLKDMKVGEISRPFESTDNEGRNGNTLYKIIRLDKIIPSHTATFENDFNVLLDIAKNQKSFREIEEFIKEKQEATYIVIDPMFQKCDFQREGWIK
ncbi:MAG TPA: peptidylprolyl isomerase [Candidatus Coprenecus stercoripullorum]|nr:peptidylprolyl isomerase [Candidatus Coprenecus stercoripullorum]